MAKTLTVARLPGGHRFSLAAPSATYGGIDDAFD